MSDDPTNPTSRPDTGGLQGLSRTADEARDAAREKGAEVSDQIRQGAGEARDEVTRRAEDVKDQSGEELARTASALETAAAELEGSPAQQRLFREAASGLTDISQAIRGKSIEQIVGSLSEAGRRNPVAFLGSAALTGFALARFARASERPTTGASRSVGTAQPSPRPDPASMPGDPLTTTMRTSNA